MATISGLTAERMLAIEAQSVVGGHIDGDDLILEKFDESTINAGSVRGPQGDQGPAGDVSLAQLNEAILSALPIGSIIEYMFDPAPDNWEIMMGQRIVNGATLYPDYWAKIPSVMKDGSDILMIDTRRRVSVGYDATDTDFDTIGKVGGAKTVNIAKAQLPATPLAINPPATTVSINPPATTISINPPALTVSIDPPSTSITVDPPATTISIDPPSTQSYSTDISHTHNYQVRSTSQNVQSGSGATVSDTVVSAIATSSAGGSHSHTVNIPAFNATVDIAPFVVAVDIPSFNTSVDIPAFDSSVNIDAFDTTVDIAPFDSENLGSGDPLSIVQSYVVFHKIVKVL